MVAAHWYDVSNGTSNPFSSVTRQNEGPSPTSVSVVPTGVAGKEADESPAKSELVQNPDVLGSASRFHFFKEDSTNLIASTKGANGDDNADDEQNDESETPGHASNELNFAMMKVESDFLPKPSAFVTSPSQTTQQTQQTQQTAVTGNISAQSPKKESETKQGVRSRLALCGSDFPSNSERKGKENSSPENRYSRLALCGSELPEEIRESLQDVNATMRQIVSLRFGPEEKEAVRETFKDAKKYTIAKVRSALTRTPKNDIVEREEEDDEEEDGDFRDEANEANERKTMEKPTRRKRSSSGERIEQQPQPERPITRMLV